MVLISEPTFWMVKTNVDDIFSVRTASARVYFMFEWLKRDLDFFVCYPHGTFDFLF